uniref:Fibronectin type-III domain-containing protein n=1 Tax=Globodera pallida TaxID=36090 RepID=A0A183CKL1_GLOPA
MIWFCLVAQSGVDASWTDVRNSTFALTDWPQRFLYVDQLHPATLLMTIAMRLTTASAVDGKAAQQQLQLQQKDGGKKAVLVETFFQQSQQARTKAGTPSTPLDVKLANEPGCAYDANTKQSDWPTGKCEGGGWTLRWAEPSFDGGEPIQNYAVEYRASGQTEWEIAERGLPPDRLFWRVAWSETHARRGKTPSDEKLAQGQFRVRAANVEGFGEFDTRRRVIKALQAMAPPASAFGVHAVSAVHVAVVGL